MSPPFTPPMSLHDGIFDSSMAWPQQYIPGLYLPGSNIQASRLRSSFNANNVPTEEVNMLHNFEMQQQQSFHDGSSFSHSYISASSMSHPRRQETLTPSNLNDVFASHLSSPRFADQLANSSAFSSSKISIVRNQLHQQQSMLSPIRTNVFSPRLVDQNLLQVPFGLSSLRMMSPRSMEPLSPIGTRVSTLAQQEKQKPLYSPNSCDAGSNGVGSPMSMSKWESSSAKLDWSVQTDEPGHLSKLSYTEHNVNEPDVSWIQSLVKESPSDAKEITSVPESGTLLPIECSN